MNIKKLWTITLFCLLFLGFGWAFRDKYVSSGQIHECDNVFSSPVYNSFKNQMLAFIVNDKCQYPLFYEKNSSSLLLNALFNSALKPREYHENWVEALRRELRFISPTTPSETVQFYRRFCQWLMTCPELTPSIQEFLYQKYIFPTSQYDTLELISHYHQKISSDSSLFNPYKHPRLDDGFLFGNLYANLFKLGNSQKTQVIRIPNCAKDVSLLSSFLIPPEQGVHEEFSNYITHLGDQKHLYVNLMKRRGKELKKSRLLENFEASQKALLLVTLDKDSSFYWQSFDDSKSSEAQVFKETFIHHMFKEKGDFYWSKKLNREEWQKECRELVNNIHAQFFANRPFLQNQERKDFIELSYLAIIEALVFKFQPSCLNLSCKQSMDRGPSLTTLLYVEHCLKRGDSLEECHGEILTMLFAPPILIHNRHSHDSRIDRFLSALRTLQNHYKKRAFTLPIDSSLPHKI
ncbi:hypothetical protein PHSC3_001226 [Chlamydiales bacterium STE3]|nr:hypothetical protein PHSC3_001226 [Chlamydiales bacterium STE3]